jgi:predicted porin
VANGFIGTPTLGQLRFGSNGVLAVPNMYVGHIMGSDRYRSARRRLRPDFWYAGSGGAFATNFWYSATGNLNRATGIGYYSPQFFGFDFGVSYAPSENGFLGGCNDANVPLAQCDRISTVTANADHRYRNIIDAMLRYRGTFGPVGVAASGGLRTADTTSAVGGATARKSPTVGIIGAEVTYAGFTVGGITSFGSASRGFASGAGILPRTGNNDGMFSWQLGARYTFGAFTVGGAYHELRSEGSQAVAARS